MQDPQVVGVAGRWLQALVADNLRTKLRARGVGNAEVAECLGIKLNQVGNKLNGRSSITVGELAALSIRFGIEVLPVLSNRSELFPPEVRPLLRWVDAPQGDEAFIREANVVVAEMDLQQLARAVGQRLKNDQDIPRRLLEDGDLRRHVIGGVSDVGIDIDSVFASTSPSVAFWIGPSRAGAVGTFAGSASLSRDDDLAEETTRLLKTLVDLADSAALTPLLVAVMSPQLLAALGINLDAQGNRRLLVPGTNGTVDASVDGIEGFQDGCVTVLQVHGVLSELVQDSSTQDTDVDSGPPIT